MTSHYRHDVLGNTSFYARAIAHEHDKTNRLPAIEDRFTGAGLPRPAPGVLAGIRQVGAADGLLLDPVYTGKAFYGLTQILADDPALRRSTVVLIHTGGIFGVFPYASELFPADS